VIWRMAVHVVVLQEVLLRPFSATMSRIALAGLVVIVLGIGPKVRGFEPGRGRWVYRAIKVCRTTSFREEVKPLAQCLRFYRYEKIYLVGKNSAFSRQVSPASALGVCWLLPEISVG
jgi:hypothetical protein